MIKFNTLIIYFFTLIFLFNMNYSWGDEVFYLKKSFFSNQPKSSISATSTDGTAKWFDDYPSAKSNQELEFGFFLPKNYSLSFRNSQLNGVHSGEATKKVCILGYCSFIGAGIVTGNSETDKISYDINSWQVILDKSYDFKSKFKIKPKIGVNVLDTVLQYSGVGESVKETQIAPLPFLGITSEFKINDRYSFYADMHYFKYNTDKLGIHYYDKSIGINIDLYKYLKFVVGYKKYDLGVSNTGGSSNITFDINQETPFVGFTVSY